MPAKFEDGIQWVNLDGHDVAIETRLREELTLYEELIGYTHQSALYASLTPSFRWNELDITASLWPLRRTIEDLRAVWNLAVQGRYWQAGTVAATLFENALVVVSIAGHVERGRQMLTHPGSNRPWNVMQTCEYLVEFVEGASNTSKALEHYHVYEWLCKFKHPNFQGSYHDKRTDKSRLEPLFEILAIPEVTDGTIATTKSMLHAVAAYASYASAAFFKALEPYDQRSKARALELLDTGTDLGMAKAIATSMVPRMQAEVNLRLDKTTKEVTEVMKLVQVVVHRAKKDAKRSMKRKKRKS